MKQDPWKSPSLRSFAGNPKLVRQAQAYARIDSALRCLIALPQTKGASPKFTLRRRLAAAQVDISMQLDEVWGEGIGVLRKSIADSHGPVDPLASASGLAAYVDVAEHTLGAFEVILKGGSPSSPGAHFLQRTIGLPAPWSPARYDKATSWIQEHLAVVDLRAMGVYATQDIARQRGLVKLTALQLKQQEARRAARVACYDSDGKLLTDAKSVLAPLANSPTPLMHKELVKMVPFEMRKLKMVTDYLQIERLVRNTPRKGFSITPFGLSMLRFSTSRG